MHAHTCPTMTTAPKEPTVTVPGQTARTCLDLDQLAMNTNPSYLSNCARDMACTQVTCQGGGVLSGRIDSATIALSSPCEVPPGIIVSLVESGTTVVNQLITGHMTITYNAGIATVNVNVFVNGTTDSVGILIDPIAIITIFGTTTDYLISFTSVQLDKSLCTQTTESTNTGSTSVQEGSTTTTMPSITNKETGATISTSPGPTETITASVFDTCTGLDHLAMNANPELLSDCARDTGCTKVTCNAAGIISTELDSMIITLELCETPPGVTIELLKDGSTIIDQLITMPTNVTQSFSFVTLAAYVFVNSTHNTLGILVDPVNIDAGAFSETLISFTLVPFNITPQCNNIVGATLQSMTTSNAALSVMLSFGLFLLTLVVLFVNC